MQREMEISKVGEKGGNKYEDEVVIIASVNEAGYNWYSVAKYATDIMQRGANLIIQDIMFDSRKNPDAYLLLESMMQLESSKKSKQGRRRIFYDEKHFIETYLEWKTGRYTARDAAKLLGLKYDTYRRYVKRYEYYGTIIRK